MATSFRTRLIATVIGLIALTAGFVAVLSFVLVRTSLQSQLVNDAVARAEFNITVLATSDQLANDVGREAFEASGLVGRFLLRGTDGVYVEFDDGDTFASSLGLLGTSELLSPDLRQLVKQNQYGYQFLSTDETSTLVVGARRSPAGPDFYFFSSAADVDNAVAQLARVLTIAGVGVLLVGALAAGVIARRVLRPVAVAGRAAGLMAEGDLTVRLPAGTTDELGALAVAFNQMAASLEDQIAALVAAHDRERRFVGDVSHELRTPITALVNESARLEGYLDELPETERRVGQMLVGDVGRLRDLIEDLLEVSRLDAPETALEASDVEVDRFLEAVIANRHPAAELDVAAGIGPIQIDRRSLERIVGNLLDNARHHAPDAPVRVQAWLSANVLHVTIADEGPGVQPEALPHLFDRFYKTDESRQGGSGLGLAIARQHARRLGGDLMATLASPQGLVFELQVPVTESLLPGDVAEKTTLHAEGESSDTRSTS